MAFCCGPKGQVRFPYIFRRFLAARMDFNNCLCLPRLCAMRMARDAARSNHSATGVLTRQRGLLWPCDSDQVMGARSGSRGISQITSPGCIAPTLSRWIRALSDRIRYPWMYSYSTSGKSSRWLSPKDVKNDKGPVNNPAMPETANLATDVVGWLTAASLRTTRTGNTNRAAAPARNFANQRRMIVSGNTTASPISEPCQTSRSQGGAPGPEFATHAAAVAKAVISPKWQTTAKTCNRNAIRREVAETTTSGFGCGKPRMGMCDRSIARLYQPVLPLTPAPRPLGCAPL